MTIDSHKRKRSFSEGYVDQDHTRLSRQSRLQARISGLIERHGIYHPLLGHSKSESLMSGFIKYVWPEIRDDYHQMTHFLEGFLKNVLKERNIDAEVSSRVKDDVSIAKTLRRRQQGLAAQRGSGFNSYQEIFYEMHDLSGLRIVLMDREHRNRVQKMIEELFKKQKSTAHFGPDRQVGQFWKKPWFGAYETHNHRVQLGNDNKANTGACYQYSGVAFEIQLTTFSDNLYNKLAHDLLYKADPGLITGQEEMVIDVSHGLARCFELCMRILQPKLHRETDKKMVGAAEDFQEYTERDVILARSAVSDLERDLKSQSEPDRIVQQLRKLLSAKEDAEDQACLRDLLVSDPRDDKKRIEETKGGLLPQSYSWILEDYDFQQWRENGERRPFWITGAPGKGKTMMLCGIINELRAQPGTNVSYFFCQGTDKRINTSTAILRGLLFLLCNQQYSLISHIREKYDIAGGKLFEDTNAWFALSEIFGKVLEDSVLRYTYVVVDALDECLESSRQHITKLIFQMSNDHPNVKWIVSSRQIHEFDTHLPGATHLSLESRRESVSEAVNAYVDVQVAKLREKRVHLSEITKIADKLKQTSEGTFLWVAIVCKELECAQEYEVMEILQEMPVDLNELYGKLIQDIRTLKRKAPTYCQCVLRAVTLAFRPLTLKELQQLADLPQNVPADAIARMCRSLLTIRDGTVFFVHQSAKDFMSNEWNTIFQLSVRDMHESMFSRSVEAMRGTLRQDIYCLAHPGILIEEIESPSPDPLASIRYSCIYWTTHFREAHLGSIGDVVDDFLRFHFLHWFEALGLIRSASACAHALQDLVTLSNEGPLSERLLDLASDMYRFARTYEEIIAKAPLQVYSSALVFSPIRSLTRMLFTSKEPAWIVQKPRVEEGWKGCLKTLSGHLGEVRSVVFSSDGHRIASGSSDGAIKIWDAESGTEVLTLQGHRAPVCSVTFDEKGQIITSKSHDAFVKTWDVETGVCNSTCESSIESTDKVAFSPDKRFRAEYSSSDIIVKDMHRGSDTEDMDSGSETESLILRGHRGAILSACFSPDGRRIASRSEDNTVKIWDARTSVEIFTLLGYRAGVRSVCFSNDGLRIASGLSDGTIDVWDVEGSIQISTEDGHCFHRYQVNSIASTLDGRRIASGSEDNTVKIWDAETGDSIQTIEHGFESGIWSIILSPDGRFVATSTLDDMVVISDTESGAELSTFSDPFVGPVALSLDGHRLATSLDTTGIVEIKETESDRRVVTLRGHSDDVMSLAFSPKDCRIVASASLDKTIKIWNIIVGAEIWSINVGIQVWSLRFDSTGDFLDTDGNGPLLCSTRSSNSTPSHNDIVVPQIRQHGYGLNQDCSWITWHGQNILWIPREFRGTKDLGCTRGVRDVLPHMISIGCKSGRVWWVTFSPQHHPFVL